MRQNGINRRCFLQSVQFCLENRVRSGLRKQIITYEKDKFSNLYRTDKAIYEIYSSKISSPFYTYLTPNHTEQSTICTHLSTKHTVHSTKRTELLAKYGKEMYTENQNGIGGS